MARKIRLMVVDDSAVVRRAARDILAKDPAIELIAAVSDPLFAMEAMKKEWPDVIVLDIEMPRMDGLSFLRKIMEERPTPVIICSTLTERGTQTAVEAMAAGAVSIITKPRLGLNSFLEDEASNFIGAIRAAAEVEPRRLRRAPQATKPLLDQPAMTSTTERVIAIGTSTGGTQALEAILVRLPRSVCGIVIVQHMPEKFTAMFAERLNSLCQVQVKEAVDGDRVMTGHVLIAPGGRHMVLRRSGARYLVQVSDGPVVNRHKPSVDVLFRSVAETAGANALGVILTGMGDDGARGLLAMHAAGASTIAEDASTCVVFGMPQEAIKRGAVDRVLPLPVVAQALMEYSRHA